MSDERKQRGRALAARLFAGAPASGPLPADMRRYTVEHLFGDVWQGEALAIEQRSMITCCLLAASGREAELRLHIRGARHLGIGRKALEAAITHTAHYAGWPAGASGLRVLAEVWKSMDIETETSGEGSEP